MTDAQPVRSEDKTVAEALSVIEAFEQVLEAAPEDIGALDALYRAHEIVGNRARAREYLLRLARLYLEQRNFAEAEALREDLRRLGGGDAETTGLLARLDALSQPSPPPAAPTGTEDEIAIVESELALAWRLHSAELLDQETYAAVANDVTEAAARSDGGVISALHALHRRSFAGFDDLIAFLAKDSRTPMIPANAFEVTPECRALLPTEFMARRGVVPLDTIGSAALIAVLNPMDEALRNEIRRRTGRECHFFLTWPAHFEARLARLLSAPGS